MSFSDSLKHWRAAVILGFPSNTGGEIIIVVFGLSVDHSTTLWSLIFSVWGVMNTLC